MEVAEFNAMTPQAAAELLRPVCASNAWLAAVIDGRPYPDADDLAARSDEVLAEVDWPAIEQALTAHPRIGERAAGSDRAASWSRQEQSGATDASPDVAGQLRAGNLVYEQRFGHVFLICATGRTAHETLAALNERLHNDADAERQVVRHELAAIVRLRLAKALG